MRSSSLDDLGDQFAPPGSSAFIRWFELQAEDSRRKLDQDVELLRMSLEPLETCGAWRARGFLSFEAYLRARFDLEAGQWAAIREAKNGTPLGAVLGKHGTNQHTRGGASSTSIPRGSDRVAYLAARLRRDFPELEFDEGKRGDVRRAAIEAGIVKVLSPFERCINLLPKLDEAELRAISTMAHELAEGKAVTT